MNGYKSVEGLDIIEENGSDLQLLKQQLDDCRVQLNEKEKIIKLMRCENFLSVLRLNFNPEPKTQRCFRHWKNITVESKSTVIKSRSELKEKVGEHIEFAENKLIKEYSSSNESLKLALVCSHYFLQVVKMCFITFSVY